MKDIVIQVEHVSKMYRIGQLGHGTLQKDLQSFWARLWKREDPNTLLEMNGQGGGKPGNGRFLALDDVSFEICRGESVGIIGRNGAGKSTLLKILSRIVTPEKGLIRMRGRISSLLEVGTGFHPEQSGRDNIYLNGGILGMKRHEIKRYFDEIVEFSEIGEFIDTPIKRYSSGMKIRLAFSIAAHFLAEIVILDEVLAVGDHFFQQKCMNKMEQLLKNEGRTLLFVSHSMPSVQRMCQRGLFLDHGHLLMDAPINEVAAAYHQQHLQSNHSAASINQQSDAA
ncbi:MAG: ABC transporter ATP-binding protein [Planctomycetaceae bacterium]|jgi:lipopolysaccharide transport system ATP-binding protein|nr:ABC transporter ATP-binding protein [Planctomycetaceae bacterium]